MTKRVCVIPGDGIGVEVIDATLAVLGEMSADLAFDRRDAGLASRNRTGEYLPAATLDAAKRADAVLFGAITSPLASEDPHYESVILRLRKELDLFANVRPAKDWGQPSREKGLDIVLVRENTEGLYNALEVADDAGVTTHRRVTRAASERIVRFAFELAERERRASLTCVHKANVLRRSDGLFRDAFLAEAKPHPTVAPRELLVDNAALQLVREPAKIPAIVTLNLYGDVLSDLAAGLVGGLGFAPSGSYGPRSALFEPVHGSAPDIAGKGIANPYATLLSAAMMLRHLGFVSQAHELDIAVAAAIHDGKLTPDAGGKWSTSDVASAVIGHLL
ncbi:MAG: isocitrate/isopropylmalate dehydrogenase family protein [Thermoplasmatota archaeon]